MALLGFGGGGLSPTVLNARLKELRETGIVASAPDEGYGLTPAGAELLVALGSLDEWARKWARRMAR